jgi:hypothetical protein
MDGYCDLMICSKENEHRETGVRNPTHLCF